MPPDKPRPAFIRTLRIEEIRARAQEIVLDLDVAERAALAAELDLPSVERLVARYALTRDGEEVALTGRIEADLHQTCIVTLDPFPVALAVPVEIAFAPPRAAAPGHDREGDAQEIEFGLDSRDPPEPLVDGTIDLAAVTREFLALALDPYPRKPGAAFAEPAPETARPSPFSALARLKPEG